MTPNRTRSSFNTRSVGRAVRYNREMQGKFFKRYAALPIVVEGRVIWLKSYWVEYIQQLAHEASTYLAYDYRRITEETFITETLKGNIVDGELQEPFDAGITIRYRQRG